MEELEGDKELKSFLRACEDGNLEEVRRLLPNFLPSTEKHRTLRQQRKIKNEGLRLAYEHEHGDVVKELLKAGAGYEVLEELQKKAQASKVEAPLESTARRVSNKVATHDWSQLDEYLNAETPAIPTLSDLADPVKLQKQILANLESRYDFVRKQFREGNYAEAVDALTALSKTVVNALGREKAGNGVGHLQTIEKIGEGATLPPKAIKILQKKYLDIVRNNKKDPSVKTCVKESALLDAAAGKQTISFARMRAIAIYVKEKDADMVLSQIGHVLQAKEGIKGIVPAIKKRILAGFLPTEGIVEYMLKKPEHIQSLLPLVKDRRDFSPKLLSTLNKAELDAYSGELAAKVQHANQIVQEVREPKAKQKIILKSIWTELDLLKNAELKRIFKLVLQESKPPKSIKEDLKSLVEAVNQNKLSDVEELCKKNPLLEKMYAIAQTHLREDRPRGPHA